MKRIVIDAREYPTSTGRYIRKLLEYLEKIDANSEREYVVLIKSADFDSYQPKAKNFSKVKADFKEFTFAEQLGLLRLIRSLKPDLVHFGKDHQPLLYLRKSVTTMHDLTTARFYNPNKNWFYFKFKQIVYVMLLQIVARKSKRIITISEFVKKDIVHFTHIKPKKITVTLESADKIHSPAEVLKKFEKKPFLLYVGRTLPHKNLQRLVEAFAILKESHPDLNLVFVGKKDSLSTRLDNYAKKNNIKDVHFTGYVAEGQLRWLYENCSSYVFPSLSEGFGLPPLEAMVHGAPVASSNATCLPEINGDAVHYFDPLDVNDMAKKINDVLTDENLRKDLIKKGSIQVKKYSWERMATQTLEIYKQLLGM